jgi:hypothetical protein
MDTKTILIVVALLVLVLYGCFPSANAQDNRPQMDPADCYARVNAAVRDDWAELSKVQRLVIGMRAIDLCENGGNQ